MPDFFYSMLRFISASSPRKGHKADMVVDETIPEPDDSCLSTEPFTKN